MEIEIHCQEYRTFQKLHSTKLILPLHFIAANAQCGHHHVLVRSGVPEFCLIQQGNVYQREWQQFPAIGRL